MSFKQQDRERLEQAIKDADARLRVFKTTLEGILKELSDLKAVEIAINENIECLKKEKITTLMHEFKKAKEDLSKTLNRSLLVKADFKKIQLAMNEVEQYLFKSKTELVEYLREPNNILVFRKKDAKE